MALGWDFEKDPVDLDASVCCFSASYEFQAACFFGKTNLFDGGIVHSGDDRSGDGDGDDETIKINLGKIPDDTVYITAIVNSYDGAPFKNIKNAYSRLVNEGGEETHRFDVSGCGDESALIMCTIYRNLSGEGEWRLKAHAVEVNGTTYKKNIGDMTQCLQNMWSKSG